MKLIHKSYIDMLKCKQRGREVKLWSNMNVEIEKIVSDCNVCDIYMKEQAAEPIKPTATLYIRYSLNILDLFDFENRKHLLVVDNYSKYFDLTQFESATTSSVIAAMN